jgi:hypothetical protein
MCGAEHGRVDEGCVRGRVEDEVGVDVVAEGVERRVVDVEQHGLLDALVVAVVVRLAQVLLGVVDDAGQLVGIGAGRRERVQRRAVDRVEPRVDRVPVVGLDRRLHLVDVLNLVGAGRVGRRRRHGPVRAGGTGQRESEGRERGHPRRDRETGRAPATERRKRAIHRVSTPGGSIGNAGTLSRPGPRAPQVSSRACLTQHAQTGA